MDKNTITGFVLMGLVLVLFTWLGRPSQEELAMQQWYNDSVALVQQQQLEAEALQRKIEETPHQYLGLDTLPPAQRDSVEQLLQQNRFGEMAVSGQGTEEYFTLGNDSVTFRFSSKGGSPVASTLAGYNSYLGEPVQLMREGDFRFGFTFITASNRVIDSQDLYFQGEQLSPTELRMVAHANGGEALVITYKLLPKYLLGVTIEGKGGFEKILARNTPFLDAHFAHSIFQNEKSLSTEQRYSGIAFEAPNDEVEKLNTNKSVTEEVNSAKWVAHRDMFFSTFVYNPNGLQSVAMTSEMYKEGNEQGALKRLESKFVLPLEEASKPIQLMIYNGPNDYALLRTLDKELAQDTHFAQIVDLGGWFRFITVWVVIPVFNFLEKYISNYGLIILLLTLFIKLLLTPFTYKSFMSQAKMRVLRPQVEAINAKYPGDENAMKRQQETMALYQRAGVNTLGGCLPMLLQMPILVAMYQYFPTSINLRGESFLWANDLSTYDDVISWGLNIPFIGSHLSLFTLIMTVMQVVYMRITQRDSGQQQMPGMKWMPVIMAVFLFAFLNNNAAALSYYYLLSMLISMAQTWIFRRAIDEEKLLAQLEENKKKPRKKSGFMKRLEEMQKEQEKRLREQNKR